MSFIQFTIVILLVTLAYIGLKKVVEKFISLKEPTIDTPLSEFRESHAVSLAVQNSLLDIRQGVVQKFEKMCIIDPVTYKNDSSLPDIIAAYKDIISGKTLDPHGYNVPSRELLGSPNPDYLKYLHNQAAALSINDHTLSSIYKEEEKRIKDRAKREELKNEIMALLIGNNIPILIAHAAMSGNKLDQYTSSNWISFYKKIKDYIAISDHQTMTTTIISFLESYDDLSIILDDDMFSKFSIFHQHNLPVIVIKRLLAKEITDDQASRALTRVETLHIGFEEAIDDILSMDRRKEEEETLRKSYGWI